MEKSSPSIYRDVHALAQCLASYFRDPGKCYMFFFSVVFQASTGKKLCGKKAQKFDATNTAIVSRDDSENHANSHNVQRLPCQPVA